MVAELTFFTWALPYINQPSFSSQCSSKHESAVSFYVDSSLRYFSKSGFLIAGKGKSWALLNTFQVFLIKLAIKARMLADGLAPWLENRPVLVPYSCLFSLQSQFSYAGRGY